MTTYQSMFLCLMALFIVVLLAGILLLLITRYKEHKRFQCGVNDTIDDIKYAVRNVYSNVDNIGVFVSKLQNNIAALCERIVTEQSKPIDPVDIPIWVAEPCPGCGHKPVVLPVTDNRDAMVYCKNCDKFGYTAGGETIRGAVYMWNKTVAEYLAKANVHEEAVMKTCNNDYCDI